MPATPLRNVRVPDDVWALAQQRAARDEVPLSVMIVAFLRAYGDDVRPEPAEDGPPAR